MKTRRQTEQEQLRLLHLPDACLARIVYFAAEGAPWKERCRLAEVCRTFRQLFSAAAFAGHGSMNLNLNSLSWRLMERKRRAAARAELVAAIARVAPAVRQLTLRYQLDAATGLSLEALLAPLAPYVQRLEVEDGLCMPLLRALGGGATAACSTGTSPSKRGASTSGSGGGGTAWAALQEVSLGGCNLWIDLEAHELASLADVMAGMPQLTSKVTKFECSCQGMAEGGESFFNNLTALQSLELEDWVAWDLPRDYAPLRAMPHLSRLVLHIVEDLAGNLENLQSLTQVQELSLVGCYRACRGLSQLTNLVMLDLQPLQDLAGEEGADLQLEAAAAWKARSLTELRWCGDLAFDAGEGAVDLPNLVALEIDEAYFPPSGFHPQLCAALTQLTSLRLVGGRCARLPPAISQLAALQVLAIDSCQLPAMPPAISQLRSVTNLQLSNTGLSPTLPPWVMHLPVRKLWLANNKLTSLVASRGPKGSGSAAGYQARKEEWLGRLTHVCLSSNSLREVPPPLLQHATALQELDLAYNHSLQLSSKTADLVEDMASLRLLRLEKSYWLRLEDRWTQSSLRAIFKLQKQRPSLQVDWQHHTGVRLAW